MRCPLSIVILAALAVQAQAQLTLPYSGTDPTATLSSFQITKSGTAGRANTLYITNASNTSDVLLVNTIGLGKAAYFSINNAANTSQTLRADSNGSGAVMFGLMTGNGRAGLFRISNPANSNYALQGQTDGSGPAIRGQAGTGLAGEFIGGVQITSAGTALQVFGGSTFTDTATFANAVATQFVGGGAGLTDLDAGNVAAGTLSTARLPVPLHLTGAVDLNATIKGTNASSVFGTGVFGTSTATSGFGYGVWGSTASDNGTAVFGSANAESGSNFGGRFLNGSTSGTGVLGFATRGNGFNIGVWGQSDSTEGRGVFGRATKASGFTYGGRFENSSTSGRGVYGWARAASGTTYGVAGEVSSPDPTAFAVYAFGRVGASGTKPFRIDHPFDPENKYLFHYSTEMPEPQNAYNGHVTTDANGEAWVQLPDYFGEINKDFEYQLTVVDDADSDQFVMAKIAREIRENKFKIRTSKPKVKVSWRVEAKRNDLWVRKYGAPVEADKQGLERGKYQHPDLYGKPEQMGMNYRPESDSPASRPTRPTNPKR